MKNDRDKCYKCGKPTPKSKLNEALLVGDSDGKKLVCDVCLKEMARKWEEWLS